MGSLMRLTCEVRPSCKDFHSHVIKKECGDRTVLLPDSHFCRFHTLSLAINWTMQHPHPRTWRRTCRCSRRSGHSSGTFGFQPACLQRLLTSDECVPRLTRDDPDPGHRSFHNLQRVPEARCLTIGFPKGIFHIYSWFTCTFPHNAVSFFAGEKTNMATTRVKESCLPWWVAFDIFTQDANPLPFLFLQPPAKNQVRR